MRGLWFVAVLLSGVGICSAQELLKLDLTREAECARWVAQHDVGELKAGPEGLIIRITGSDPYVAGPAMDLPPGELLWLKLRAKSEQGGMLQIFYFQQNPTEEASVRVHVRPGTWEQIRIPMPAMGKNWRLRVDPPGDGGVAVLGMVSFEKRTALKEPAWPKPVEAEIGANPIRVKAGEIDLLQSRTELGAFVVNVAGRKVGIGLNRGIIGYVVGEEQRWVDLNAAKLQTDEASLTATVKDPDGGTWVVRQTFAAGSENALDVVTRLTVDQDRDIIYLPVLGISVGPGWVGEKKKQAIFAGLEYLDRDEPSSSEADIEGPGSKRQVPDSLKITMPLMAVVGNDGRYVGMIWEPRKRLAAVFDSPDRLFKSGGHVLALIVPGANGENRVDGSLVPHGPEKLEAGNTLEFKATIIGGRGTSAVQAIKHYVAIRGLPAVPDFGMDLPGYVRLTAAGWLDSKIREGNRFRHAWPGGFEPHPAADAAMWIDWLAGKCTDPALKKRLEDAANDALALVPTASRNFAAVGHVRYPVVSLLYGGTKENAANAKAHGKSLLNRFEKDGRVLYRKPATGLDYGRTHFEPDANGLTAQLVMTLLESASLSGDKDLIKQGLRLLDALDRFIDTVPRGAQTWEVPLHTPDILASAHLVHAYLRGYELTGDDRMLEKAKYWAWTGVPFVYLVKPVDSGVGEYATIAVLGATWWKAPNWMGLPVQWCGLVYADELYRLAQYDERGPWKKLADGITASGIQQTWPLGKDPARQGLLPDSFALRAQVRNDAAINPATVQANAVRLLTQGEVYNFHAFRSSGLLVHAPAAIADPREASDRVSFKVAGCFKDKYDILIAGCAKQPKLKVNGTEPGPDGYEYVNNEGWLIVHLNGDATVEIGQW